MKFKKIELTQNSILHVYKIKGNKIKLTQTSINDNEFFTADPKDLSRVLSLVKKEDIHIVLTEKWINFMVIVDKIHIDVNIEYGSIDYNIN